MDNEIKICSKGTVSFDGVDYILNNYGLYYNCAGHSNNYIFEHIGLNKKDFTKTILGYYKSGDWPYGETVEDCHKLMLAVIKQAWQSGKFNTIRIKYSDELIDWREHLTKELSCFTHSFYDGEIWLVLERGPIDEIVKVSTDSSLASTLGVDYTSIYTGGEIIWEPLEKTFKSFYSDIAHSLSEDKSKETVLKIDVKRKNIKFNFKN